MTTELERKIRYHYGNGLRKFRRIFDLTHKETVALTGLTPQQLTALERKEQWTAEELQQVCDKMNIPVSGLTFLAEKTSPSCFIIQHNTLGDGGMIGINNYLNESHTMGDTKIAELLEKVEHTLLELSKKVESLEKKIDSLQYPNTEGTDVSVKRNDTAL